MATGNTDEQTCEQADAVDENWRDNKSLRRCAEYYLLKECMSDVTFIIRKDGDRKLRAHRLILSMRSAVFEAMFFGPMSDNRREVEVEDIETDIFDLVLRYIYTDKAKLDGETVLKCMHAAKKYCLVGLVKLCSTFLENSISPENVCTIYEQAKFFAVKELETNCYQFIIDNSKEVFQSDDITQMSSESIQLILENEQLSSEEKLHFEMVARWASAKCQSEGKEDTGENKRMFLKDILRTIRFPVIPPEEFARKIVPTGILTAEDQIEIFKFMVSGITETHGKVCQFNALPRKGKSLQVNFETRRIVRTVTSGDETLDSPEDTALRIFSTDDIKLEKLTIAKGTSCSSVVEINVKGFPNERFEVECRDVEEPDDIYTDKTFENLVLRANKHYELIFRDYDYYDEPKTSVIYHTAKFGDMSVQIAEIPEELHKMVIKRV